jgi:HTH-type transcriptional regulator/antitoxin HigA
MITDQMFKPDWASPPGDTVADLLEERGLTVADFASQLDEPIKDVESLLAGRAPITPRTAEKLANTLGSTARFWLNREAVFQRDLLTAKERRTDNEAWIKGLPVADMIRMEWIPAAKTVADKLVACFDFFDVESCDEWREKTASVMGVASFRTSLSFDSETGAAAAWLRQGEILANKIACKPWNADSFRAALSEIRGLTFKRDPASFIPELTKICAASGVAVVVAKAPSGCRASGATRFLSPDRALILLSFRYLSDDHFWFTFFHEAGHVLLHGQRRLFVEGVDTQCPIEEQEANEFAAGVIIPSEEKAALLALRADHKAVIRFAQRIGISPGIVVGQLQHLKRLRHDQLNTLKRRFQWA